MQGLIALENTALREKQQPKPVSNVDEIASLEASLRAPPNEKRTCNAPPTSWQSPSPLRKKPSTAPSSAAANSTSDGTQRQTAPGPTRESFQRQGTRHRNSIRWVAYSPHMKRMPRPRKNYLIGKHGDEQAFTLAVSARLAFMAELT